MDIKPAEITDILKREIKEYDREVDVAETGTVLSVGDGIARVFGLEKVMAGELVELPGGLSGLVLNLEEDNVGIAVMGETHHVREGDSVRRTGRILEVPVGMELVGRVVGALGNPIDGKPAIAVEREPPRRAEGARHRGAQVGARAAADRHQGDRRHDADRPRPARADHRRPPDRQDRDRDRHDHQPEEDRRVLHLRRDRPEAVDRRAGGGQAEPARRDGLHDRGGRDRQRAGAAAVHRPLHGRDDGRVVPRQRQARADHLRRSLEARRRLPRSSRCCCGGRRAARPIPATSSTCTRGCSSAPPR